MPQLEYAVLAQAVIEGNAEEARRLARAWAESGLDPLQAVERGFAEGLRRVGELWEEGDYFLPELIQGAEAMKAGLETLRPSLQATRGEQRMKGRANDARVGSRDRRDACRKCPSGGNRGGGAGLVREDLGSARPPAIL